MKPTNETTNMTCPHCVALQEKYSNLQIRECRPRDDLDTHTALHQPKHKATGARVFIHPRCLQGPASGALTACLQEHGYDLDKISVGPADKKGRCELVRLHGTDPDGLLHLERMDGDRFDYRPMGFNPGGSAA